MKQLQNGNKRGEEKLLKTTQEDKSYLEMVIKIRRKLNQ